MSIQYYDELPHPPDNLTVEAKSIWYEIGTLLVERKKLSNLYYQTFAILCQSIADFKKLSDELNQTGFVVETLSHSGVMMTKENPRFKLRDQLLARIIVMTREFQLTPKSDVNNSEQFEKTVTNGFKEEFESL